jgi:DNA polymerase-1
MADKPRLVLIDGHALAYRAYFALTRASEDSRWITKSGEPTAGTYGFTSVLLRLLEHDHPEYLAVSFDTGKTFRDDLYPDYKATRDKMPDDLRPQLERIREVVAAFGIPILEADGFEADDVLGTVARLAEKGKVRVHILTGDRDLLQLVDDRVHVLLAGQKLSEAVDYGPDEVENRFGVSPEQFVDYKALVGDSSDNIPGVRGIGEKTAVTLLKELGSLANIYEHLDAVPERFRSKLMEGHDSALLSQKLSRIVTDVPVTFDLEACRARDYDRERVVALFRELEFRSLADRIAPSASTTGRQMSMFAAAAATTSEQVGKATIVSDVKALAALARRLEAAQQIAFDVETTSTDPMRAELVGISVATEAGTGFYIPVGHNPAFAGGPQLPLDAAIDALQGPLTDPKKPKVGHNLKYDFVVLGRHGLRAAPLSFDTMLAEWLCDPSSRNLGLKSLAFVRLGLEMTPITHLIGSGRNQRSMADVPIADAGPYAAADAEVCLRLMPELARELGDKQQLALFQDVEMPLVSVLADMEIEGVALDVEFLASLSASMAGRLAEIEAGIYQQVGYSFNINSTQQLSAVLFKDLKLSPPDRTRRTSAGHLSTAASVLDELRHAHPVVDLIIEQREIAKLKSTYADALPLEVNPATRRVHTSYSQTGAVTGRLASSDPNLQNIPIRTELGRLIRQAFIAAPGKSLISVDYSQIELRIVAHMSEDPAMIKAFQEDQDIHAATAAAVFGTPPGGVTQEMRRRAKAVNFGLIYGMSPFGLSRSTDLTLAEAEEFVRVYFQRFPGVRQFLDQVRRRAAEVGHVETMLGRRRYFPQLMQGATAVPEQARSRAEREAINAPIQGTAADIIKLAMLKLPGALNQAGLSARMLLQVHDELVFECPEAELATAIQLVKEVMQSPLTLRVPLKTDAKVGRNWAEMKPVA